jgi:hypothetical protein
VCVCVCVCVRGVRGDMGDVWHVLKDNVVRVDACGSADGGCPCPQQHPLAAARSY